MTTTPNPPASIESLRDLELLYAAASHYAAEWPIDWLPSSAYGRLRAALSELEGLRERCAALAQQVVDAGELHLADESTIANLNRKLSDQGMSLELAHAGLAKDSMEVDAIIAERDAERSRADALGARVEALEAHLRRRNEYGWTPNADALLSSTPAADLAARDARVRREEREAIHPRNWSRPMSEAWHRNIPNVDAAFSAVIAILTPTTPAPAAGGSKEEK